MEEELQIVKNDFDHLNIIYQSSYNEGESSKPAKCENCKVLEAKVKYFVKTPSKLAKGTSNLNAVLGSQNCVFDKAGIGFKPMFKKKTRNGRMRWIPKGSINHFGPKANRVPGFIK